MLNPYKMLIQINIMGQLVQKYCAQQYGIAILEKYDRYVKGKQVTLKHNIVFYQ